MTDPVIQEAIKLRDRLKDAAKEFRILEKRATHKATKKMAGRDAEACEESALMLQKLGTEVTRLREGIGCFKYGQLSRFDLIKMRDNWNDDSETQAPA